MKFNYFLILVSVLGLIFFIGISLGIYSVSLENIELRQEITQFKKQENDRFETLDDFIKHHKVEIEALKHDRNIHNVKIGVIEESLDPENTRWAKVKKVREAVTNVIKDKGYPNTPNVKGLTSLAAAVVDYSEKYDVPVSLILGVITAESAFVPKAKSNMGAQGLMQIMPATAKEISQDVGKRYYNIFKIRDNIRFGTWYIWKMIDRFDGDVELAVRAYNCGPTCVEKVTVGQWDSYPQQTIDYHKKVLMWKSEYERMGL